MADILGQFPRSKYIVGTAEVNLSADSLKDRRLAEILARLEIAKQLRVRVREESIDIMCEGKPSQLFAGANECRNILSTVIEVTVDEVLVGSRIVEAGKDSVRGIYYAVAVLSREDAAATSERGLKESMEKAVEFLNKARMSTDPDAKKVYAEKAKEAFLKGVVYEGGSLAFEDTRLRAKDFFEKFAEEIRELFLTVDKKSEHQ